MIFRIVRLLSPSSRTRAGNFDNAAGNMDPLGAGHCRISPQLTAFFTSAPILASSAAVNSLSAKEVGHMAPSSRFASSLKPNVAYLVLNFRAFWKKQTTLPSLAYAGIPYQVLGERAGALALTMAWSRSAMARSGFGISAIFASTSLSPSALSAFSSWARSFIAARSSSVNPLTALRVALALLADFFVSVFGLIEPPSSTHSSALGDAQSRAQQPTCLAAQASKLSGTGPRDDEIRLLRRAALEYSSALQHEAARFPCNLPDDPLEADEEIG